MEAPKTQPPQEIQNLLNTPETPVSDSTAAAEEAYLEGKVVNAGREAAANAPNGGFVREEDYTLDQVSLGIRLEYLKTLRQNNVERKKYAGLIFAFTCLWAAMIFLIIFLAGFKKVELTDTVLVALITTTTINFFGFFLLVVKYLFNTGILSDSGPSKTDA